MHHSLSPNGSAHWRWLATRRGSSDGRRSRRSWTRYGALHRGRHPDGGDACGRDCRDQVADLMCNRARLDGDPETLRERFGAKWLAAPPNRWPVELTPVAKGIVVREQGGERHRRDELGCARRPGEVADDQRPQPCPPAVEAAGRASRAPLPGAADRVLRMDADRA